MNYYDALRLIQENKDYGGYVKEEELAKAISLVPEMPHDAWKQAFDDRHEFDVYPEHFMSGMRNEFAAGWHAALKKIGRGS